MTRNVRILGLSLAPWRFGVVAAAGFVFALTAGGAWLPVAREGSAPLCILLSAQMATLVLLSMAAMFLYTGVQRWQPTWRSTTVFFNAAVLGGYLGNQVLPLVIGCW